MDKIYYNTLMGVVKAKYINSVEATLAAQGAQWDR